MALLFEALSLDVENMIDLSLENHVITADQSQCESVSNAAIKEL